MYELGTFLKKERLNRGKSIKESAEKLEVSSAYISMVENNKTIPNSDYLYNLSSFLYGGDDVFEMLVAEKYIVFCLVGGIKVQPYPFVKFLLSERGMFEENSMVNKPYYSLNWLFNQQKSPITFGLKNENPYNNDIEEVYPISQYDYFNGEPKSFIQLDSKDKEFIYKIIETYIKSKYSDKVMDQLDVDNNNVDLIIERLHESTGNPDIAMPLLTIDDLTEFTNKKEVISIRKNWKIINLTNLEFFITKNSIEGIRSSNGSLGSFSIVGEIFYKETKNSLTDFEIKFPKNYLIDINSKTKEITFNYNND